MTSIERLHASGILRRGSASRGFRYVRAGGGRLPKHEVARIRKMALPPAWRDVAISASSGARLQAVGKDAAGRWQYVYHPAHVQARERDKHRRLIRFGAALPALRRAMARDLRGEALARDAVLAVAVRILAAGCIRPGSEAYAAQNGSFGIATLRSRHVAVRGDTIQLDFPAKSGVRAQPTLRDAVAARALRRMLRLPGREVLKYVVDGRVVDVKRADITAYVRERMGGDFTGKDFRTWSATVICASALARLAAAEPPESKRAMRSMTKAALCETADQLGNTPAICRSSYVSACVFDAFERGKVLQHYAPNTEALLARTRRGLSKVEHALLRLLQAELRT